MSIGNWNPETGSEQVSCHIDVAILARCAAFARSENWSNLSAWVSEELPADAPQMMTLAAEQWQPALNTLDYEVLLLLVRFFTVIEHDLPNWHGGDKSPVIWISRHMKKHGKPLSRECVLWIKSHSSNRFLPNGPIF